MMPESVSIPFVSLVVLVMLATASLGCCVVILYCVAVLNRLCGGAVVVSRRRVAELPREVVERAAMAKRVWVDPDLAGGQSQRNSVSILRTERGSAALSTRAEELLAKGVEP